MGDRHHHHSHGGDLTPPGNDENHRTKSTASTQSNRATAQQQPQRNPEPISGACMCCSDDPARDLETLQQMAADVQQMHDTDTDEPQHGHESHDHGVPEENQEEDLEENEETKQGDAESTNEVQVDAKLMRMSINTAIAIGLHNFPEVGRCQSCSVAVFHYHTTKPASFGNNTTSRD